MPLPNDYTGQDCSLARALEVVGERWTLLIVRDLLYGVRRFNDFRRHLNIPSAVLRDRLNRLVEKGIAQRTAGSTSYQEYTPTEAGEQLWPVIWSLMSWGNRFRGTCDEPRTFTHADCGHAISNRGDCPKCGTFPPVHDIVIQPKNPQQVTTNVVADAPKDAIGEALRAPHRLLTPF